MKRSVCLVFLAFSGCGDPSTRDDLTLERHSDGVPIVESSPPFISWTLNADPVVRIGAGHEPEYQLSNVVFAGRLSDGGVVVVDGGSSEVRWYDHEGRFRSRAGGPGQGPGELLWVTGATLTQDDTLALYDSRNQRLNWFAPDGGAVATRRLELESGSDKWLHALEDGRLLIVEERHTLNVGGREYNLTRDSLLVLLITSGGDEALDTVMRLPGREATTWVDYQDGQPVGMRQMELPFGQVTLAGGTGDRIAVVESGRSDLALFDEGGALLRRARRADVEPPEASVPLRDDYVSSYVQWGQQRGLSAAQAEAVARERLDLLPEGQRIPAFDRLLTDAVAKQFWLRDFLPEVKVDHQRRWTVHDLRGRVVAQLTTPPDFRLMQVRDTHVVGVETDELGVEYVVVYSLEPDSAV